MFKKLKLFVSNVSSFKFKYWWLVIIAMLIHRLPFAIFSPPEAVIIKKVAMITAYIILIFALLKNSKLFGICVILAGVLLNFAAIVFNAGLMPVSPEALSNANLSSIGAVVGGVLPKGTGILLTVQETNLWWLTDIMPVRQLRLVCSVGDLIMLVGVFVLGIQIIHRAYTRTTLSKFNSLPKKAAPEIGKT
jgi:hypothetical protein